MSAPFIETVRLPPSPPIALSLSSSASPMALSLSSREIALSLSSSASPMASLLLSLTSRR